MVVTFLVGLTLVLNLYKHINSPEARLCLSRQLKDFTYFFREENANTFHISRGKNRIRLPLGKKDNPFLISESMSALIPDRSVVPCIAEFLPGVEGAGFDPPIFEGLELVFVIDGSLTLSAGTEKQRLRASDSAWIEGTVKRQYECHGDTRARA